jgi:hypothetical protein
MKQKAMTVCQVGYKGENTGFISQGKYNAFIGKKKLFFSTLLCSVPGGLQIKLTKDS